jgi:histidine triad (HIT) family protein
MPTLFKKIIDREIPAFIIAENEEFIAILDAFPLVKGHSLVIPKKEIDYIFDLEDDLLARMHIFSKNIARALKKAIPCPKIGMAVIGLEVPHAHIHLVPLNQVSDLNFSNPKLKVDSQEMEIIRDMIKSFL